MALELSGAEFFGEDGTPGYFRYEPGEHLLVVEPTGGGKTFLTYRALRAAMRQHPGLSVVSLMPKPRDPSTAAWAEALNLQETPVWPPRRKLLKSKPAGHVLWPRHEMGLPPAQRREAIGKILRAGIDAQYRAGDSITFVDDAHSAAIFMGLNEYLEELLVNGRSGGAAGWLALQKPSGSASTGSVSSFAYSSASHIFLGRDNDARNIRRFGEIGGFDPARVERIVRNLRLYRVGGHTVSEKLYLDQRGPYMARISP